MSTAQPSPSVTSSPKRTGRINWKLSLDPRWNCLGTDEKGNGRDNVPFKELSYRERLVLAVRIEQDSIEMHHRFPNHSPMGIVQLNARTLHFRPIVTSNAYR
jgi:hypothetical protein